MAEKRLEKILYVEDELDIQAVAQIALEVVGDFNVKVCSSGQDALSVAQAYAPDLLLLDVMMPEMDGPATLAALRNLSGFDAIPAMFMTGKVQPEEVADLKSLGVIDVIAKPFDAMTLAQSIRDSWSRHLS